MNLQLFVSLLIGLLIGALISYFVFDSKECPEIPASDTKCHWLDSAFAKSICDISFEEELNDMELIQYFSNYVNNTDPHFIDTFGFSVSADLIHAMSSRIGQYSRIHGFRLFPGLRDPGSISSKVILVKELNDKGLESKGIGFVHSERTIDQLRGPCPNWCGESGRVIVRTN